MGSSINGYKCNAFFLLSRYKIRSRFFDFVIKSGAIKYIGNSVIFPKIKIKICELLHGQGF